MPTNERIKALRKELDLTQTEFGDKILLKQSTIGQLESGARKITDRTVVDICREFGVNEEWLRTGQGDMFVPLGDDIEFERVWTQIRLSNSENADFIKRTMRAFWSLSDEKQTAIIDLVDKIAEKK